MSLPEPASAPSPTFREVRRLALITPHYPVPGEDEHAGGLRTYAKLVAEAMVGRGWVVDVLATDAGGHGGPRESGVDVIPIALPRLHWRLGMLEPIVQGISLWRRVRSLDRRHRFDAIECIHMDGIGWALAITFRKRFFLRMHTSARQHATFSLKTLAPNERARVRWDRITARAAYHLVTHSKTHASEMALENGVPIDRIAVVYHATPSAPQHALGTGDRVLLLGSMETRKGVDTFIRASAVDQSGGSSRRWTAVGRHAESWLAYREQHCSGAELVGPVSDQELERYWSETRCVVIPSRYESFGLVAIEAMARGIPLVAARGGALPEVVGNAGVMVDVDRPDQLSAAVARIFDDPASESAMQRAGLERYRQEFTIARFAERLDRLYCGAVSADG